MEELKNLLEEELASILAHAKGDYEDVQLWAKQCAAMAARAVKEGHMDALEEVKDHALLLAEICRIRLNRKLKERVKYFLDAAMKVAVKLL
jgi:hypothetical protein